MPRRQQPKKKRLFSLVTFSLFFPCSFGMDAQEEGKNKSAAFPKLNGTLTG